MMPGRVLPAFIVIFAAAGFGLGTPAAKADGVYSIDGFVLGEGVEPGRDFQCGAAEQVANFTWCQRTRQERGRRGTFSSTHAILQNQSDVAIYVGRTIEPAFFGSSEIQNELNRLSNRFGSRPREFRIQQREGVPNGVIAIWGKLQLEPLNADVLAALRSAEPSRQNMLVDHLGDLKRSIELGLPVYRLSGGAGYLWSASANTSGRGYLRFLAADPSAMFATPIAAKAVADKPATDKPAADKFVTDKVVAQKPKPKTAAVHPAPVLSALPEPEPAPKPVDVDGANTTVRAKSKPGVARLDNELSRVVFTPQPVSPQPVAPLPATLQSVTSGVQAPEYTGSIPVEPVRAAPSHRTAWLVGIGGMTAVFLFLLSLLMERPRREPTGLELLEIEQRQQDALEQDERPLRRVQRSSSWPDFRGIATASGASAIAKVRPLLGIVATLPARIAAYREAALVRMNDALKEFAFRLVTPETKA